MIFQRNVHLKDAHKTPQFWLIWWVLCLNASNSFCVLGIALYALAPIAAGLGSKLLFVVLSIYGVASSRGQLIWPTCSARSSLAPFTGGC